MKDRLTSIVAIVLLVTLVGLSYWYSVKAELESTVHLSDLNSPDFIAHNIAITKFDKDGTAKSKVFSEKVEHYSDGHAFSEKPRYYSLNPDEPQVKGRSDKATMVKGGEVVHFYGNVKIHQEGSEDNPPSEMRTSQLDAYPDTSTYSSDEKVYLNRGNDLSEGVGMDFDNVERTFKLRSQVKSTFQPKSFREARRQP